MYSKLKQFFLPFLQKIYFADELRIVNIESYKLLRQPGILYDEEKIKWLDEIGTDQTQCYYSEDLVV